MLKYCPLILLMLFMPWLITAQKAAKPEQLTLKDGLSQGFISALVQDREGFLWIGTKNGLNRYDGEHIKVFTNDPADPYSLANDWVTALYEEGDFLLVGMEQAFQVFHKQTQRFYQILHENGGVIGCSAIVAGDIYRDSLGQFWIHDIETNHLLCLQFPESFWRDFPQQEELLEEVKVLEVPIPNAQPVAYIHEGNYLLAYVPMKDLWKVDIQTGNFEAFELKFPTDRYRFNYTYPNGPLIAYSDKLFLFKEENWQEIQSDFPLFPLNFTKPGHQLWLPSESELLLFEAKMLKTGLLKRENALVVLSNNKGGVRTTIKDRSGNIWAGTNGYGVLKVSPRPLKVKTYFTGISIQTRPFMAANGEILFGNDFRNAVLYYPGTQPRFYNTPLYEMAKSYSDGPMTRTIDGTPLLYHSIDDKSMIYTITPEGNISEKPLFDASGTIKETITVTKEGKILLAGPHVLVIYDPENRETKRHDFSGIINNEYICYSVAETGNGHYWIGTNRGLCHASPVEKGLAFELIEVIQGNTTGLLSNDVASLLPDPNDEAILWIGTKGGGLHRLDTRTMTFQHLTTRNGLPNDVVYGILPDDEGNLWMSSNKGIIRYTPATGAIRNFTEADGMQSDEFNTHAYAKGPNGELLFGGINGLNVFHPDDLRDNPVVPNVLITGLTINNNAVTVGDSSGLLSNTIEYTKEITLPFSDNNITLDFVALEFSAPLKNRFRYYLDGLEKPWIHENTDNRASYFNLAPGAYTFKIKGANGDGIWNETPTELKINILPPWYQTPIAYAIYMLLAGLGIWQLLKFRENRLRLKHEVEMEQKEAARLLELDHFKSTLYTNITHEFRTPLTIISGMAEQIKNNPELWVNKGSRMIKQNAANLLNLVNQMLELRQLDSKKLNLNLIQGDIVHYLRYLTESYQPHAQSKALKLHFLTEQSSLFMDYDPEKLLRIISNLLSNAIKFTPAGGHVYFYLDQKIVDDQAYLLIQIRDTGVGIPQAKLPHIFDRFYQVDNSMTRKGEGTGIGLALTLELVKLLKGEITVDSIEGEGTTFSIHLPIKREAPLSTSSTSPPAPLTPEREPQPASSFTPPSTPQHLNISPPQQINTSTNKHLTQPTLLLIEDNPDVVEYLIACLNESYQLEVARNGQEGIDKAIEQVPDLIVSDVMMPKKNGFEVCAILKEDERTSHIPIVLLTAKADMDAKISGLERGADAYLTKPFEPRELLVRLRKLLDLRKKLQKRYRSLELVKPDPGPEDLFLEKVRQAVLNKLDNPDFGIEELCQAVTLSRAQLHNKLKALTGLSTSIYIRSIRLNKAKQLLESSNLNVSEVAYEVGFKDPKYFSRLFTNEFKKPPSHWTSE